MDPLFMLQAVGFRATSGNQVESVIELGADGFAAGWERDPSKEDAEEFDRWAARKLDVDLATHMADPDRPDILQQSRQAYAVWKKKLEGS